jgi:hypothetical protein
VEGAPVELATTGAAVGALGENAKQPRQRTARPGGTRSALATGRIVRPARRSACLGATGPGEQPSQGATARPLAAIRHGAGATRTATHRAAHPAATGDRQCHCDQADKQRLFHDCLSFPGKLSTEPQKHTAAGPAPADGRIRQVSSDPLSSAYRPNTRKNRENRYNRDSRIEYPDLCSFASPPALVDLVGSDASLFQSLGVSPRGIPGRHGPARVSDVA